MNLTLVGFMGTGKTRVGVRVAAELKMTFLDMDDLIEERQGKKISGIFAERGERFFRNLERDLAQELARRDGLVIATGGGIVLDPRNLSDFERSGPVVCLSATPEAIFRRIAAQTHRPLLQGGEKMRGILSLLEKRKPLYDAIPHQIDTTALSLDQVAAKVVAVYREAERRPA